jgi:hypothetical protein
MSDDDIKVAAHQKHRRCHWCIECRQVWPCLTRRLAADLAASQALAESRSLALATMREACLEDHTDDHLYLGGYLCRLCGHDVAPDVPEEHAKSCVLYSDGNRPADAAAALAGAVLLAADRMGRALDALVLGDATPVEAHAMLDAYRRARAALRGGGAVEG